MWFITGAIFPQNSPIGIQTVLYVPLVESDAADLTANAFQHILSSGTCSILKLFEDCHYEDTMRI